MRVALTVAAAIGAVVFAGCGGTKLDQKQTEKLISSAVTAETGAPVKSVSCPSDQKVEKNAKFTCTVTGKDNSKADLPVTVADTKGSLKFRPVPFTHPAQIAESISTALTQRVKAKIEVTCQDIAIAKAGGKLTCVATDTTKQKSKVFVTQTDAFGNVQYRVEG